MYNIIPVLRKIQASTWKIVLFNKVFVEINVKGELNQKRNEKQM